MTTNKKTGDRLVPYWLNPQTNEVATLNEEKPLDGVTGMTFLWRPEPKKREGK